MSETATPMQDTDRMPWGKYKDVPMQEVPASYLFWLWTERGMENEKTSRVADYIRRNLASLELDYPDGEWRKP